MDMEMQGASLPANSSLRRAPSRGSLTRSLLTHRDLVADLAVLVVVVIVFLTTETGTPRDNYIPKDMLYQYSYPVKASTVPSWEVLLIVFLVPPACFIVHAFLQQRPYRELLKLVLALVVSVLLTASITNCIKLAIGRPRPNFLTSCWPPGNTPVWLHSDSYGGYPSCSTDPSVYAEHLKSFPSGHSSASASGLGFLTFFLLGQTKAFAGSGNVWRVTVSLLPALGAIAIGITRVFDYWHHPTDVMTGLLLGFSISLAMYLQLYPGWTNWDCNLPRELLLLRQQQQQQQQQATALEDTVAREPLIPPGDIRRDGPAHTSAGLYSGIVY